MQALFYKNKKRKYLFNQLEKKKKILKLLIYNYIFNTKKNSLQSKAFFLLKTLPKNSSEVRLKNRCLITNRGRSVYKDFGLSRLTFRELVNKGKIPGLKKSSW